MYEAICKNNILLFSLTLIHSISTYLYLILLILILINLVSSHQICFIHTLVCYVKMHRLKCIFL